MRESPLSIAKPGAQPLGADDHRPQLQQLEVDAVLADAGLAVKHRAADLELDRERCNRKQRARDNKSRRGGDDVEKALPGHGAQRTSESRATCSGWAQPRL